MAPTQISRKTLSDPAADGFRFSDHAWHARKLQNRSTEPQLPDGESNRVNQQTDSQDRKNETRQRRVVLLLEDLFA